MDEEKIGEKMTNEEKAKEIASKEIIGLGPDYYDVAYDSAMEMAKWKEKQLIEKACEWLYNRQVIDLEVPDIDKFVSDFRRAMEEQ